MIRNKSRFSLALTLLSGAMLLAPPARASTGFVNFLVGQKAMDSADWGTIDQQTAFGVETAFGQNKWPVLVAAYFTRSSSSVDSTLTDSNGEPFLVHDQYSTQEVGIGLNKTFTIKKRIHPYISAGGTLGHVGETFKQSGVSVSRTGGSVGFWSTFSAFYRMGTRFNVGGLVRYSSCTVDLKELVSGAQTFEAQSISEGGTTYGVVFGWGWPATK
jgi:hypothetical protein